MVKRSVRDVIIRLDYMQKLAERLHKENRYSKKVLFAEMQKKYKTYSQATFYRDLTEINQDNTFVRDIVESNFSSMVEENYRSLEKIEDNVEEWEKSPPQIRKDYVEYEETGNLIKNKQGKLDKEVRSILKKSVIETMSPLTILQFKVDIIRFKLEILKGNIVDTSIALITNKFERMEEELAQKDVELQKLKGNTESTYSSNFTNQRKG